jgi:DNA polymerase-1
VKGIGEKTAEKLFREFRSLEDVRDRMAEVPPTIRKKLEGNEEAMFLYRQLTRLHTDCCTVPLEEMAVAAMDGGEARTILREFEMSALLRELDSLIRQGIVKLAEAPEEASPAASAAAPARAVRGGAQLSLFDAAPSVSAPDAVHDVSALPSCAGKAVAVTPPPVVDRSQDRGLCVAVRGASGVQEFLYVGDVRALVDWIRGAALIVVPDFKKLLHSHPVWGILPPAQCFDIGLAAYLLAPEDRDYGWPSLAARHSQSSGLPLEHPGELALSLCDEQTARLERDGLIPLLMNVEMPLIPVLASMEDAGIAIDRAALKAFLGEVQGELDRLTARIYEEAGESFNIRSAQQIGDILFK